MGQTSWVRPFDATSVPGGVPTDLPRRPREGALRAGKGLCISPRPPSDGHVTGRPVPSYRRSGRNGELQLLGQLDICQVLQSARPSDEESPRCELMVHP